MQIKREISLILILYFFIFNNKNDTVMVYSDEKKRLVKVPKTSAYICTSLQSLWVDFTNRAGM